MTYLRTPDLFELYPDNLSNGYRKDLKMCTTYCWTWSGTPTFLRLEAWPPAGDITEYIPKRLHNLVQDLPIQPYTLQERNLNLASSIPDCFPRPEMEPKMHIAFGNVLYLNKARTNLHPEWNYQVSFAASWWGRMCPNDEEKGQRNPNWCGRIRF